MFLSVILEGVVGGVWDGGVWRRPRRKAERVEMVRKKSTT